VSAWTLHEYLGLLPAADSRHPAVDALAYAATPIHYGALASGDITLAVVSPLSARNCGRSVGAKDGRSAGLSDRGRGLRTPIPGASPCG
jgi:hypothetical protein